MALGDLIQKAGYVRRFALHLERNTLGSPANLGAAAHPTLLDVRTFFLVVISDSQSADANIVEFRLLRDQQSKPVDNSQGEFPLAVTWQAVSMAMIATVKESFFRGARVTLTGVERTAAFATFPVGMPFNELHTVDMLA